MNPSATTKIVVLPNGLKIVAVNYPNIRSVTLHTWIFAGSAYEKAETNGISHFLEHMIFRGNRKIGGAQEMNLRFEQLGGELNASTSNDLTEYWFHFHRNFLKEGIQLYCQFLQYPLFEFLEIERKIILEEVKGDYNEEDLLTDVDSLTSKALWPDDPMGFPIIGVKETIKAIQEKHLRDWHQEFYYPANMVIGITGNFDLEEVCENIAQQFSQTKSQKERKLLTPSNFAPSQGNQLLLVPDKDNQYEFQWCFPVEHVTPDERVHLRLLSRILDDGFSSRLQRLIREEKGLVYDISGDIEYSEGKAIYSIHAVIGEEKILELCSTLTSLVRDLIQDGMKEEELKLAKLRLRTHLDYSLDSAEGILFAKVRPFVNTNSISNEQFLQKVDQCTLEDINRLLQKIFLQKRTILALVGPLTDEIRSQVKEELADWTL